MIRNYANDGAFCYMNAIYVHSKNTVKDIYRTLNVIFIFY